MQCFHDHLINSKIDTSKHPFIDYIEDGYNMTLTDAPNDRGGRLLVNLARTTPLLPCGLVTLPQIHLIFELSLSLAAL